MCKFQFRTGVRMENSVRTDGVPNFCTDPVGTSLLLCNFQLLQLPTQVPRSCGVVKNSALVLTPRVPAYDARIRACTGLLCHPPFQRTK